MPDAHPRRHIWRVSTVTMGTSSKQCCEKPGHTAGFGRGWRCGRQRRNRFPIFDLRGASRTSAAEERPHDAGMESTSKLQKAGRTFLLRLIAEHGLLEAAWILRRLAEELVEFWREVERREEHDRRASPTAVRWSHLSHS